MVTNTDFSRKHKFREIMTEVGLGILLSYIEISTKAEQNLTEGLVFFFFFGLFRAAKSMAY